MKLLDVLCDKQAIFDFKKEQLTRGNAPKTSNARNIRRNERLINVVKKYLEIPIIDYLRSIANTLMI